MPWSVGNSSFYESVIQAIAERYEIDLDTPWDELTRGAAEPLPLRHEGRARLRPVPQPDGPAALVHARVRGDRPEPAAALPRDRLVAAARADRGVHVVPAVPGLQGRAAEARGARGHGRRATIHEFTQLSVTRALEFLDELELTRDRAADRRADRQGDPRAADVPRQRRRRLPAPRPRVGDAVGRRGAAAAARDADRLAARRRALHPRRAVDRAPPARQRPADRDARAAARPRQHRARRRARRADDAQRRLARRHGAGRGRARRPRRRRGHGGEGRAQRRARSRASSSPGKRAIAVPERRGRGPRLLHGARRVAAQPEGHRRRVPGRQVHLRHRRLGLGQVDARQRDRLQGAREPAEPDAREAGRARVASRGSTSSTR